MSKQQLKLVKESELKLVGESVKYQTARNPYETYTVLKPLCDTHPDVEKMYFIFMRKDGYDDVHQILAIESLSTGFTDQFTVYLREIVKRALELQADAE